MKFTCLSEGRGYHFPPCHILDLCGLRILLDVPLDLSSLSAFAPVPSHLGRREVQASDLGPCIYSVPWYKTVDSLHLWDVSFINVVLISSGMGILGLPYLTRMKGFAAKVYATEVTMKLGQLMMNDLISMHREFRQTYGPDDPNWMKWEELEKLTPALKELLLGEDGSRLGGWLPLYSTDDVKGCIQRVQPLRYGEEACYNGNLVISAVSSGLDIGTSNWTINTPKQDVAHICNSVAGSAQAMDFDYRSLQARDVIIYSDLSSLQNVGDAEGTNIDQEPSIESLLCADRALQEESEKVAFICSCAFDAIRAGGSVLLPIGRLGVILQLLEQLSTHQELSSLKVPIFMISSVSEELLLLFNVVPEWLSKQKQEKLFAGEPLFAHVNLLKEGKLHLIPDLCSPKLLKLWREPCIVFCPHWSLRLGPAVHLLRRWREDENSLLVLDQAIDSDLALLPFKPMKMKVLQCSFLSGIRSEMIMPLMSKLQPGMILSPEGSSKLVGGPNVDSISLLHYSENETVCVPRLKGILELDIDVDLASQFQWKTLEDEATGIARLKGQLSVDHGRYRLILGSDPIGPTPCRLHWGTLDMGRLLTALEKAGINASVDRSLGEGSDASFVVNVAEPNKALMEVKSNSVVISTDDQKLASLLFEAVDSILDSI